MCPWHEVFLVVNMVEVVVHVRVRFYGKGNII